LGLKGRGEFVFNMLKEFVGQTEKEFPIYISSVHAIFDYICETFFVSEKELSKKICDAAMTALCVSASVDHVPETWISMEL